MKHTDTADGVNGLLPEAGSREVGRLKAALADKEAELSLNAEMLARQCDLAREAESKAADLQGCLNIVQQELVACQVEKLGLYIDIKSTREKEAELSSWKDIAQRNNASGCCCKFDVPENPSKIIEACAFHALWRDEALTELREKVRRWKKAKIIHNNLRLTLDRFNLNKALAELEEAEGVLCAADGLPEAAARKSFEALSEDKGLDKIVKGE